MRWELSVLIFAPVDVECDRAHEAISALIDGEDPGLPEDVLDAHLAGCAACRTWLQAAHDVTRRARIGGPFLDRDLTSSVLAAIAPAPPKRRRRVARRAGLTMAALAQLAITVPLLILGHDHEAGVHAAHELGSFDLALAIAFAVGAIRPALSAGLAWPCAAAAAGLAGTAIADLASGQTIGADEAQHLIAVCGTVLLFWQARTAGKESAGQALAAGAAAIAGITRTPPLRQPAGEPDSAGCGEQGPRRDGQRGAPRRSGHSGDGNRAVA